MQTVILSLGLVVLMLGQMIYLGLAVGKPIVLTLCLESDSRGIQSLRVLLLVLGASLPHTHVVLLSISRLSYFTFF